MFGTFRSRPTSSCDLDDDIRTLVIAVSTLFLVAWLVYQRVMANFRLGDFFPQKFTWENNASPLAHWLQYQDYCGANELVQAEWVTRFRITLSGQARLWIEGKQFADVNDLKSE